MSRTPDEIAPIAWRWTDGNGYNADYRYSRVDPREHPDEVWRQGADCIGGCTPLYGPEALTAEREAREKAEAALREIEPMLPGIAHLRARAEKAEAEVATWIERHDLKRDELFKAEAERDEARNAALREAAEHCRAAEFEALGEPVKWKDIRWAFQRHILALIKEPSHD